jgi:hypothetical protein
MLTSSQLGELNLMDIMEIIPDAISIFGRNVYTDAVNFIYIFIGMSWVTGGVPANVVPAMGVTSKHIWELLSNEKSSRVLAKDIAKYLNQNGSMYSVDGLIPMMLENVFPILHRRLNSQFNTRKSDNESGKPGSSSPPAGSRRQRPTSDGDDSGLREGRHAEIIMGSRLADYRLTEQRSLATGRITGQMSPAARKIILFVKKLTGLDEIVEETQDSVESGCDREQCMQGIQRALSVFTESDHSVIEMRLLLRTVIELLREDVENAYSVYEYSSSVIVNLIINTFNGFMKNLKTKQINHLRALIQRTRPTSDSDFEGGSSRHTKRPHRDTRRRKQKNKSRRKTQNKCNTKKSRKY